MIFKQFGTNKGLSSNDCKNSQIYIDCNSNNTQNYGPRRGTKRYFRKDCKSSFSSKRRPEQLQKIIFEEYILHRQTLK